MSDDSGAPRHHHPRHRRRPSRARRLALGALALVAIAGAGIAIGIALRNRAPSTPSAANQIPATTAATTAPGATATTRPTTTQPATSLPATTLPATTTTLAGVSPSSVLVQVVNGFGGKNGATDAATGLHRVGFLINGTGDAASFTYAESIVEYESGNLAAAQTLARHLGGAVELKLVSDLPATDLIEVILGSDYSGVVP
jgi:hypothetical protein